MEYYNASVDHEGRKVIWKVLDRVKTTAWVEQGVKLLIFRKNLHPAVVKIEYKPIKGGISYFIFQVKECTPETVCFAQPLSLWERAFEEEELAPSTRNISGWSLRDRCDEGAVPPPHLLLPHCHLGHPQLGAGPLLSTADWEHSLVTNPFIPISQQRCVVKFF